MSVISVNQCDQCGKRVDNGYAVRGWIRIDGSLSRAVGKWGPSSYQTAYIGSRGGGSDFCSLECLEKKLDALDELLKPGPKKPEPCPSCGAVVTEEMKR